MAAGHAPALRTPKTRPSWRVFFWLVAANAKHESSAAGRVIDCPK